AFTAGTYFVGVSSVNTNYDPRATQSGTDGLPSGPYTLTLTLGTFRLGGTRATAIPLQPAGGRPAEATGDLAFPNQADLYAVSMQAGEVLEADVTDQSLRRPSASLRFFDATGREVAAAANTGGLTTTLSFG